jgi:hypothetical protein
MTVALDAFALIPPWTSLAFPRQFPCATLRPEEDA